jgi:hypothetical protein
VADRALSSRANLAALQTAPKDGVLAITRRTQVVDSHQLDVQDRAKNAEAGFRSQHRHWFGACGGLRVKQSR